MRTFRRNVLASILIATTAVACGPQVKFVQPQPAGVKNIFRIPYAYYGSYLNTSDSSFVEIDSMGITGQWVSQKMFARDSLFELEKDLGMPIKRDTQIYISPKSDSCPDNSSFSIDVRFRTDSVKVFVTAQNRIFEISDTQLVRKYRGYCFLNTRSSEGLWLVRVLKLEGNSLTFDNLLNDDQLKKLKHITYVEGPMDSVKNTPSEYYLNPTRRELRKILRNRDSKSGYVRLTPEEQTFTPQ
ncbi:MAG: hypothetical protein AB7S54_12890 [Bacteroidales bacterium]